MVGIKKIREKKEGGAEKATPRIIVYCFSSACLFGVPHQHPRVGTFQGVQKCRTIDCFFWLKMAGMLKEHRSRCWFPSRLPNRTSEIRDNRRRQVLLPAAN